MKTHITRMRVVIMAVAIIVLVASVFALSAHADTRGTVDRGRDTQGRLPEPIPAPTPTPPAVPPAPATPLSNGGITSVTNGEVNSGGNTGGTVTTGDEHVTVVEVNIGPTNPPPPPPPPEVAPAPTGAPAPECDPRARTGCGAQDVGRAR